MSQDLQDFEIIVQDGLSSDNTIEILNSYSDDRIKILSEKDHGLYDAMNRAIARANGDVIGILNSDDFYDDKNVLSKVSELLNKDQSDCLYGDLQYVDEQNVQKIIRKWKSGIYSDENWLKGWMPPHPTFFVRKEIYKKFGKFNLVLRTSADYELMLRFLHKEKVKVSYLPQVLVKMRMGGQSNASLKNRIKANKEDKLAWKLNGLVPKWYTLYLKPIRKIKQYL